MISTPPLLAPAKRAYKNITGGQCILAERALGNFLSDLQALAAELISLLSAISPGLNPADAVEKVIRECKKGKEDYEQKLLAALDAVAVVHAKADNILVEELPGAAAGPAAPQPMAPRYVAR